ncbi:MAG TPA: putative Ig domain-containing protein, partial [Bryobacteraceae bacterium]
MLALAPALTAQDLTITTTALPSGTVGSPYTVQLTATGGTPPYSWFGSGLPAGVSISAGQLTGTPTAAFTGTVTIAVFDSAVAQ